MRLSSELHSRTKTNNGAKSSSVISDECFDPHVRRISSSILLISASIIPPRGDTNRAMMPMTICEVVSGDLGVSWLSVSGFGTGPGKMKAVQARCGIVVNNVFNTGYIPI